MAIKLKVQSDPNVALGVQDNTVRFGLGDNVHVVQSRDYDDLTNRPQINGVTLTGNKTTEDLGINLNYKLTYDGLSSVQINAMPSGSATPAATISATGATVSTGTNTLTLSKSSVSNTPQVSAGYVASGTAGNSSVSLTASVTTKAAATYYAGTSDQTISANQYLTGAQTIKAVSQTNLEAANIKSGTTVSISNGNGNIWSVTGTYTGGGGTGWTNISSTELAVNTTSTSAASAGTVALGSSAFTADKIIYVRIRDKSGARNGYFYGSDTFFMNWQKANGATTTLSVVAQEYYRYNNSAITGAAGAYGVYGYSINSSGTLTIRRRYNSTNTLTINSTYTIDVYTIDPPKALF